MAKRKDYITYHGFLRTLEQGTLKPVYLFQGPETFLIEECLDRLKQTLIPPEAEDFNSDKFSANDLGELTDVLDQAQTVPFLSQWRLVILTDVQLFSAKVQQQMLPYLSDPNPSTCLVMTAPKLDNRTKFAQAIKAAGDIVQFWKLFERDLPQWISARAKHYGYKMSLPTAQQLAACVGNDLRQLENELKKVIAYSQSREIPTEAVQQVVGDIRERDIFELVDAVSARNAAEALRVLNQLLIEGEPPLRILAMVIRQFRLLWKVKAHLVEQKSLSARQLAGKIGVPFRSAENLQNQVSRFSQVQLKQGLKHLYAVDVALKSTTTSPKILLEHVLIQLCM
ncbi:DNA polymerase III subunit delta [candidate division KSB3 bacterium]|uniref:DNA polymerase III subunit delta n=1 Tax=candidate division KSB3 bacterium TaxID=2044937 RepID=A0A9D5Q5A3_9BACT|nr:DNA polymerase III subunit delta [candidate division KSB3 bacterium]MBD3324614.1 DNA polymerase III subunit delta [candidate division KSB3 bacterium]